MTVKANVKCLYNVIENHLYLLFTNIKSDDKMLLVFPMSSGRIDLFCVGVVEYDNNVTKLVIASNISLWSPVLFPVLFPTTAVLLPGMFPLDSSCTFVRYSIQYDICISHKVLITT